MQDLISNPSHTMSSREIAALCGKRHDNVMQVLERLQGAQLLTPESQESNFDHKGNTYREWRLAKRDSYLLVARLSPEFTAHLVDRWQELEGSQESQVALPDFSDPVAAARAWADAEEAKQRAVASLEAARPAVEFADRVALADKGVKLGNFAKTIGIGPRKIFGILRDLRILMAGGERHNLPYQQYIDRGYFNVRQGTYEANGETRIGHTPLVTGKGERWLHERLQGEGYISQSVH